MWWAGPARAETLPPSGLGLRQAPPEFGKTGPAYVPVALPIEPVLIRYQAWAASAAGEHRLLLNAPDPDIRRLRELVDDVKDASLERKVRAVNAHVNASVRYGVDQALHGSADLWATPLATLTRGGDCEDLALLKAAALRLAGVEEASTRLVIGSLRRNGMTAGHALLAVDLGGGRTAWLDNANDATAMLPAGFTPMYAVNGLGTWLFGVRRAPSDGTGAAAF